MDRRRLTELLADRYVATGNVSAVVLAGSLGRGWADAFSDVELDVYWNSAPSDEQRLAPVAALDGAMTRLWPYDHGDAEWSEDVQVREVDITVSGFTISQVDRWIRAVRVGSDPDIIAQMRLSALHEGEPLHGERQVGRWVLGALCAVDRIYVEHPSFTWSQHLAERFERASDRFVRRFLAALDAGPIRGAPDLHELLVETVEIVEHDLPEGGQLSCSAWSVCSA